MQFPTLQNDEGHYLDQVQLTGMLMSCVIGIFPTERHRKQPVTIDLCLYLNTLKAAKSTNIHDTIDYAAAVTEITFILERCEFLLIESAVETICQYFLKTYTSEHLLPQVDAVMVRISKPSALTHGIIPAVQIVRQRSLQPAESQTDSRLYTSEQSTLWIHQCVPGEDVTLSQRPGLPKAALTIGKWSVDGQSVKSRSALFANHNDQKLTPHSSSPQLVLLSF